MKKKPIIANYFPFGKEELDLIDRTSKTVFMVYKVTTKFWDVTFTKNALSAVGKITAHHKN